MKPVDFAIERAGVEALVDIADDQRGRVDSVGPDFHIVRKQPPVRDCEVAVHPDVGEEAPGDLVDTRHASSAGIDRYDEAVGLPLRLAAEAHAFEGRGVERQPRRGGRIGDQRPDKCAVEQRLAVYVGTADIAGDNRGAEKLNIEREIVEASLTQIGNTASSHHDCCRADASVDISDAVFEGCGHINICHRRQSAHEQTVSHDFCRSGNPFCGKGAVAGGQHQISDIFRAQLRGEGAVPFLPAAASVQHSLYRGILAHQSSYQAIGRRIDFQIHVEPVVIGHSIEFQHHPVALQCPAGRIDHRAAISDAHLALERGDLFLAGNRLVEYDAVDFEQVDADI